MALSVGNFRFRPRVSQPFLKLPNREKSSKLWRSVNFSQSNNLKKSWVTRHRALWCSDFPPPAHAEGDSPPFQNQPYYKPKTSFNKPNHLRSGLRNAKSVGCQRLATDNGNQLLITCEFGVSVRKSNTPAIGMKTRCPAQSQIRGEHQKSWFYGLVVNLKEAVAHQNRTRRVGCSGIPVDEITQV